MAGQNARPMLMVIVLFASSKLCVSSMISCSKLCVSSMISSPPEAVPRMPWPFPPTQPAFHSISPSRAPLLPVPAPPLPNPTPPPSPSRTVHWHSLGVKGAYWSPLIAESFPPSTIPSSFFTHLFYAFVSLDPTTYQLSITQLDKQWMLNFTSTMHITNPKNKALLSIGGPDTSPTTMSLMAANLDGRAAFIKSTIDIAKRYDFDGFDLDWVFPTNHQDMSNLVILLEEWRTSINNEAILSDGRPLLLSTAVYFAPNFIPRYPQLTYPANAINEYVDLVNVMSFDYHGGWDSEFTNAPAPLYDKSSNISSSYGISLWIKESVAPEKLVMGMPMFGRSWQLKDPDEHGIGAPAVAIGPGNSGAMNYSAIVDFNQANGAIEVYDNETVSAYSYAGTYWFGYDNATSIANKVKFAKQKGLGGYFLWLIGEDRNWALSQAASMAWDGNGMINTP